MSTVSILALSHVRSMCRDGTARRIRMSAGASLSEVAEAIGSTAANVSRWERAVHLPRGEVATRYGDLLAELANFGQVAS